ncbi:hypothetical protein EZV62_000048 [Acer yangbiense]|uniref:MATH domain-containing protein n=1 Tax=Acer yangbiense TaxID=1000413 RepID=A0A5C7IQX5_9ROSI|nr:hypothetical protein EZV62_000048 [Acer yangbiense]
MKFYLYFISLFAFDALHANKADWGDLFTYNSVENFVAMASFVDEQDGVTELEFTMILIFVDCCRKIRLYPNGLKHLNRSHLSLFLLLADFTPDSKVYIDYTLRIVDQLQANHIAVKGKRLSCTSKLSVADIWK